MTALQAIMTIVFGLSISIMALVGQAKIGVLILLVALIASVITILYVMAKGAHKSRTANQFD